MLGTMPGALTCTKRSSKCAPLHMCSWALGRYTHTPGTPAECTRTPAEMVRGRASHLTRLAAPGPCAGGVCIVPAIWAALPT